MPPKPSLFKQKIKNHTKNTDSSFPKPVKIDLSLHSPQYPIPHLPQCHPIPHTQHPIHQSSPHQLPNHNPHTTIDKLLMSGLQQEHLSDLETIQSQNWKQINSMSPQQIASYQKMLEQQLPPGFLKKLKIIKEAKKEQCPQKVMKQEMKFSKKQQAQTIDIKEEKQEDEKQLKSQEKVEMGCLEKLGINIQTKEVMYIANEEHKLLLQKSTSKTQEWVHISDVKTMIQSENNQTSIIGTELFIEILNYMEQYRNIKGQILPSLISFNENTVHMHQFHVFQDLFNHILVSLIHKIKQSRFKSCWVPMYIGFMKFMAIYQATIIKYQSYKGIIKFIQQNLEQKAITEVIDGNNRMAEMLDILKKQDKNSYFEIILKFLKEVIGHKLGSISQEDTKHTIMIEQFTFDIFNTKDLEKYLMNLHQKISGQKTNLNNFSQYLHDICSFIKSSKTNSSYLLALLIAQQTEESFDGNQCPTKTVKYQYLTIIQEIQYRLYLDGLLNQTQYHTQKCQLIVDLIFHISIEIICEQNTHKFTKSYKKQLLSIIKNILWGLYSMIPQINSINSNGQLLLKNFFIMKSLNPQKFKQDFLIYVASEAIQTNMQLANIITILNLSENIEGLISDPIALIDQQQLQNINLTIQFISQSFNKYIQGKHDGIVGLLCGKMREIVIIEVLSVFGFNHEEKGGLSETIIDECLKNICACICMDQDLTVLWKLLSMEKIKEIIQLYNFNSFGNYPFTRMILFILALSTHYCQYEKQLVILEEVVTRYPYLFYYAVHLGDYYGPTWIYETAKQTDKKGWQIILNNRIQSEKDNIWQSLLIKDKVTQGRSQANLSEQKNSFIRYLIR